MAKCSAQETTSVRCEQSSVNTGKHIDGSMKTRQSVDNPADVGTRGMSIEGLKESGWLSGPAWLQTDEEKWPKPWCQVNEAELNQLIDWRQYSSFNRIRKFIAYRMRQNTHYC